MTPTLFNPGEATATSKVTNYLQKLTIVERHVRLDVFVDGLVVQQSVIPEVVARQNVGVIQLLAKRNNNNTIVSSKRRLGLSNCWKRGTEYNHIVK